MSTEDYLVQNIYNYTRRSYKNKRDTLDAYRREDTNEDISPDSPRSDGVTLDSAGCSCDIEQDGEIATILHKKCPVIALAQQQLQRLLDETDKLLCDNTKCCRSTYDFIMLCKETVMNHNKSKCIIVLLIILSFLIGLIFGGASCGTNFRKFNSPVLACIDNIFVSNTYSSFEDSLWAIV